MSQPQNQMSPRPHGRDSLAGWLLPLGFGAVAIGLFTGSRNVEIPIEQTQAVNRSELAVGPRRPALTDPAHVIVEGVAQNCNGCHQIFRSSTAPGGTLSFHQQVRLSHGMNNRCANCHDAENREQLTLRDGALVPFAQTPQLCAQCHGTVYRDWQRGTHGKTLGSWITKSDVQHRLSCNECHDPHSPKYEQYQPLPGPRTLRMGRQESLPPHAPTEKQSPLQRWLREAEDAKANHPGTDGGHP